MLTTKTSIYAVAVAAGLILSLVPQTSFAQTPPGQTRPDWIDPGSDLGKVLDDADKTSKGLDDVDKAFKPKPKKAVLPLPNPAPVPKPKSIWDEIYDFFFGSAGAPKHRLEASAFKAADLKRKMEAVGMLTPKTATKLVSVEGPKSAEINFNSVAHLKSKAFAIPTAEVDTLVGKPLVIPANAEMPAPKAPEVSTPKIDLKPKLPVIPATDVETLAPKPLVIPAKAETPAPKAPGVTTPKIDLKPTLPMISTAKVDTKVGPITIATGGTSKPLVIPTAKVATSKLVAVAVATPKIELPKPKAPAIPAVSLQTRVGPITIASVRTPTIAPVVRVPTVAVRIPMVPIIRR